MDAKSLIASDARYREILAAVLETPYIERSALEERLGYPTDDFERLLGILAKEMLVLELASQADSSIESRVPKTVYLVNPEQETVIRGQL
jgi:hypothetical protein